METTPAARRVALLLALAGFAAPVAAQVVPQSPAHVREALEVMRGGTPAGTMRLVGLKGVLDYDRGVAPAAGPVSALVTLDPGAPREPAADLGPAEESAYRVGLNWGFLDALDAAGPRHASVALPDGQRRELVFVKKQEDIGPSRYAWIGQIAGIPASDFVLARWDDFVVLHVRDYEAGERFEVRYSPVLGAHSLRTGKRQVPPEVCGACCAAGHTGEHHLHGGEEVAGGPSPAASEPQTPDAPPEPRGPEDGPGATDPTNQVDILFVATTEASSALGGLGGVTARALAIVADYNGAFLPNSGLPGGARIAHVQLTNYSEAPTLSADLTALSNGSGSLNIVPSQRSAFRADHVILIRNASQPSSSGGTITGLAYVPTNASNLDASKGFGVICLGSSNLSNTFAHELTHNFGGLHDPSNNSISSGFPSPHGFNFTCNLAFCTRGWRTVMAYNPSSSNFCISPEALPVFSSPGNAVNFGGLLSGCSSALGVAGVNNVTSLILSNRPTIAQWRVASSRQWVDNTIGGNQGTYFRPWTGIRSAVNAVQGPLGTAEILVSGGTYTEASAGNPTVINKPCTITVVAGPSGSSGSAVLR